MDIILLEKVGKLGNIGDKVVVKAGYGRNFLLPLGKAVRATASNIAEFEARRAELEKVAAAKLVEAQARAAKISALSLTITANSGDEGKLFGSIGTRDIADVATAAGVEIDKTEIRLPDGALRDIGEYEIDVQIHSDVIAVLKLTVIAE